MAACADTLGSRLLRAVVVPLLGCFAFLTLWAMLLWASLPMALLVSVAPSQVGSVEFAAARYGVRLVVVLGHSSCGAILATLEELGRPSGDQSKNLRSIVDRIRPSVEALLATELGLHTEALVEQAVRANIRASADHLRHGSEVLEQLIQNDGLVVVGAEYSLETGVVDFFDGAPNAG